MRKGAGFRLDAHDFGHEAGGLIEANEGLGGLAGDGAVLGAELVVTAGFRASRLAHDDPQIGGQVVGELEVAIQDGVFDGFLAEVFIGTKFQ